MGGLLSVLLSVVSSIVLLFMSRVVASVLVVVAGWFVMVV